MTHGGLSNYLTWSTDAYGLEPGCVSLVHSSIAFDLTVTSLLAAYRSFDTMFETTVIFVAGISLLLLLRRRREGEPGVPVSSHERRASAQDAAADEQGAEA